MNSLRSHFWQIRAMGLLSLGLSLAGLIYRVTFGAYAGFSIACGAVGFIVLGLSLAFFSDVPTIDMDEAKRIPDNIGEWL